MKVYMTERPGCPVNRRHSGEFCEACDWSLGHSTNMDSLEEAVTFTEEVLHGWVVIGAMMDWGGCPTVTMRRTMTGQEVFYIGDPDSEADWTFYEGLTGRVGERHGWWTTLDGRTIEHGMRVWDYNLDLAIVDVAASETSGRYWDGWFDMKDLEGRRSSTMNGQRMWVRHPGTGERA